MSKSCLFIFGRAGSSSAFTVGCLLQVLAHSGCGLSATPPHAIWVISNFLFDIKRQYDYYITILNNIIGVFYDSTSF